MQPAGLPAPPRPLTHPLPALRAPRSGIPFASGALYPLLHVVLPPELAAMAMAFSSVSVVVSSLLLKRFKPSGVPESALAVHAGPPLGHTPLAEAMQDASGVLERSRTVRATD